MTKVIRDWSAYTGPRVVATMGNFDGMHVGHQRLIQEVSRLGQAKQLPTMLITFEPYPFSFFKPGVNVYRLMSWRDKYNWVKNKVDYMVVLRFNRNLAAMRAQDFIDQCLKQQLNIDTLITGRDFRFGCNRLGNVTQLVANHDEHFFSKTISDINIGQQRVSSSSIRQALLNGELAQANQMLGRPFKLSARVVKGQGLGRQLGFPTANLNISSKVVVPNGVYLSKFTCSQGTFWAATNVGVRPTVGGHKRQVESHLLEFSGNLYGQRAQCQLIRKLRDEQKFASLDHLASQILKDIEQAKDLTMSPQVSL